MFADVVNVPQRNEKIKLQMLYIFKLLSLNIFKYILLECSFFIYIHLIIRGVCSVFWHLTRSDRWFLFIYLFFFIIFDYSLYTFIYAFQVNLFTKVFSAFRWNMRRQQVDVKRKSSTKIYTQDQLNCDLLGEATRY